MAFTPSTLWNRWDYETTYAGNKLEGAAPILLYDGPGWLGLIEISIVPSAGNTYWFLIFDVAAAPVAADAARSSYGPSTQPAQGAVGGSIVREFGEPSGSWLVNGQQVAPNTTPLVPSDSPFYGIGFDRKIYGALSTTGSLYTPVAANLYRVFARGTKL